MVIFRSYVSHYQRVCGIKSRGADDGLTEQHTELRGVVMALEAESC
jgi:hypothetical protein